MCRARVDHAAGFKIAPKASGPQIKLSLIDGALSRLLTALPSCRSGLVFIVLPCTAFSKSCKQRKQHIAALRAPHTEASVISHVVPFLVLVLV